MYSTEAWKVSSKRAKTNKINKGFHATVQPPPPVPIRAYISYIKLKLHTSYPLGTSYTYKCTVNTIVCKNNYISFKLTLTIDYIYTNYKLIKSLVFAK